MKQVKYLTAFSMLLLLMFRPAEDQKAQAIKPSTQIEAENNLLKKEIAAKQDSVLRNLSEAVKQKPVVIYKTRYRPKIVYVTSDNSIAGIAPGTKCDTVFYLVKKKNLLQRVFGSRAMDTLRIR